jgi:hypothetical protein
LTLNECEGSGWCAPTQPAPRTAFDGVILAALVWLSGLAFGNLHFPSFRVISMRKSVVAAALALVVTPAMARAQSEPLPPLPPASEGTQQSRQPPPLPPGPPPPPPSGAPPSPPPYPPPRIIVGCGDPSGPYCHDGFYMRLGLGLAYTSVWGSGPFGNASISGTGIALSASFGGTIARGLVLGGALRLADGVGQFTGGPSDASGSATASVVQVLGVFVDWYPAPSDGWHVGSQLGLGVTGVTDSLTRTSSAPELAGSIFGGYDWWIGPQWSLGVLMSLSTASSGTMTCGQQASGACGQAASSGDQTGYSFTPLAFALEASLLWH